MYTCVFSRRVQIQSCTDSEFSWNSSLLWGSNVWMEVVQKLVAVALVSMATSADGLQNCFRINLGMAAASAMVQAYARPQVQLYPNQVVCCKRIHECCFGFFLSCLHLLRLHPSVVLQILRFAPPPFSWPVWWCLLFCLPSFSQFTVAPCHVLIASGLFVCLWGVSLRLLPRFMVLLAACTRC